MRSIVDGTETARSAVEDRRSRGGIRFQGESTIYAEANGAISGCQWCNGPRAVSATGRSLKICITMPRHYDHGPIKPRAHVVWLPAANTPSTGVFIADPTRHANST